MANINKIGDMIEQDNKWIKFESGEKRVLKFDQTQEPTRIEGEYEGRPTLRYEFKVLDLTTNTDKLWAVSKTVAMQLRDYFAEEYYLLKIQRNGTGLNTKYQIMPAQSNPDDHGGEE
jgi:hypothetical protein